VLKQRRGGQVAPSFVAHGVRAPAARERRCGAPAEDPAFAVTSAIGGAGIGLNASVLGEAILGGRDPAPARRVLARSSDPTSCR
jgi:hypothetical protein